MTDHLTSAQLEELTVACAGRQQDDAQPLDSNTFQALANSGLNIGQTPPLVCAPGQIICREDEPGSTMYLIRTGHAAIVKGNFDAPVVLACRGPGEFVGEMALLEDLPRSASVIALDNLYLYPIPYADFQSVLGRSTKLDVGLLRKLSARLRETDDLFASNTQVSRTLTHQVSELKAANIQLQEVERLRAETTDLVIHDLRNPLHGIIGAVGLLQMVVAPEVVQANRDLFELINNSCTRLQRLVDSLLDISRIESGEMELARQPADIAQIVQAAVDRLAATLLKRDLECRQCLPASLPLMTVDEDMIDRVIVNLLDNAVKFTPAGGQITITAQVRARQLLISINDTGRGIPPEWRDHIFERFARAAGNAQPDSTQRGFGLGLTFCKLAVEAHGGRIWVEDGDGETGCKFVFTLPLDQSTPPSF
jgi:signal transduction histidine kinase